MLTTDEFAIMLKDVGLLSERYTDDNLVGISITAMAGDPVIVTLWKYLPKSNAEDLINMIAEEKYLLVDKRNSDN